jgi:hypothetical protein
VRVMAAEQNVYGEVPLALRERDQWITWRRGAQKADGRYEKEPTNPRTGYGASATDQANWTSFEQAVAAKGKPGRDGISFVPAEGGGLTLVDFDKCLDGRGKITKPWVRKWIEKANTYVERSPSGTGLRAVAFGTVPRSINNPDFDVEMYSSGQQLTITGDHLGWTPGEVCEAQEALMDLFNEYAGKGGHQNLTIDEDEPPVRLSEYALSVWRGERPKVKPDGKTDRSVTLYKIACELAKAGMSAKGIRSAIAERDAALGFRKYLDRPNERAEREYARLAVNATREAGGIPDTGTLKAAEVFSAADLMKRKLPPVRWAVPDILPEGVNILAGKPKIGKSWIALDLCLSIAQGGEAFHAVPVERGGALYLALEDNDRRLQRRIKKWLGGVGRPSYVPDFEYATEWPRVGEGCEERLREWLEGHPNARLVVIDTLKKIRPKANANRSIYDVDYEALEPLLPLAAEFSVSILVLHHARKMGSDDPLELVSGSFGLTGGVDGVLVMRRERSKQDATLYVDGRDVEDPNDFAISWDNGYGCWVLKGYAEDFRRSEERNAVLEKLAEADEPLSATDVAVETGKKTDTVRKLLRKMVRDGEVETVGSGSSTKYALPTEPPGSTPNNSPTTPSSPIDTNSPSIPIGRAEGSYGNMPPGDGPRYSPIDEPRRDAADGPSRNTGTTGTTGTDAV